MTSPWKLLSPTAGDELQLIVQNAFTPTLSGRGSQLPSCSDRYADPPCQDGVMTYGGRLNVSMINWHKFGKGERHDHGAGRHRSFIPDLRLLYARLPPPTRSRTGTKAGANYNMDIFVSPKRFLGLYSYFEMGIDRRNDETLVSW